MSSLQISMTVTASSDFVPAAGGGFDTRTLATPGTPEAALERQFLHAYSLALRLYPDNTMHTFVAPLADDLVVWLQQYRPLLWKTGLAVLSA